MSIPIGTYVGNPNNSDATEEAATQAQFQSFVSAVGRSPTFMDTYINQNGDPSTYASNAQWNADSWAASPWLKGVTPVIGVPMGYTGQAADTGFQQIISGQLDQDYLAIANAWKSDGYTTVYMRLGWEQNGNWEPWSQGSGQQTQDYIAAFQHLANLFHNVPGMNIKIVWNPNSDSSAANATATYPGNQYVDVIGIDQYSPSAGDAWGVAQAQAFALAHGKPFAIPETGTGNGSGGDVGPSWPNELQSLLTAPAAPQTAFVNIWDQNVSDGTWAFSGQTVEPGEAAGWNALAAATTSSAAADPLCFFAGTRIATPEGDRPVETLRPRDLVLTADGQCAPVRWVGCSLVSCVFADRARVLPIRIKAGSLGENVPVRDLLVSPGHGILVDGVLVHAAALVDGVSIVREPRVPQVFAYYHVELDSHALLLAEGAPAESFLDGVEQMAFSNRADRVPPEHVEEMPYPRVKSVRQLPRSIRNRLAAASGGLAA